MIKKYARKGNPTYTVEGITFDGTQAHLKVIREWVTGRKQYIVSKHLDKAVIVGTIPELWGSTNVTQGDVVYHSRDVFSVMLGNTFNELYEEIV